MSSYLYQDARSNLDDVLREIVEEAKVEDSSPTKDSDDTDTQSSQDGRMTLSDFDTPKKLAHKISRKRKKKEEFKEDKNKPNACIMKLFDRQVDLALFQEDTPLYPICRAWMNNEPQERKRPCLEPPSIPVPPTNDEEMEENCILDMPPADMPWKIIQNEKYKSPRIPSPPTQCDDRLEMYIQKPDLEPAAEDLLLAHLSRWKNIRSSWCKKAMENEKRYESGMKLLREMANKNLYTSVTSE